jgi:chromosome segregation ATPase
MRDRTVRFAIALAAFGLLCALVFPGTAAAQGKIVCWKDKSGKTIGCGDKVPPEYQSSATKELSSQGITRKSTESAEDATARRQREQEAARAKAEEDKRVIDKKRQDTALLETYSNEKEIDLKRDRDLQVLDLQIEQLTTALKSATARQADAKGRFDQAAKGQKGAPAALKDELARATADKERFERSIESKQKEKEELRARYAEFKKRYAELKGSPQPAPSQAKK